MNINNIEELLVIRDDEYVIYITFRYLNARYTNKTLQYAIVGITKTLQYVIPRYYNSYLCQLQYSVNV